MSTLATAITVPEFAHGTAASLYVHVPFCVRRCPYCDFYKVVGRDEMIPPFLQALDHEARARAPIAPRPRTVFIGGGTPSFLDEAPLRELMAILVRHFDLSAVEEWTVECNPNSLTLAKARAMREAGVTRLSIGGQSLDPGNLLFLGRVHAPDHVPHAVALARETGYATFNVDLISGLPTHYAGGSEGREPNLAAVDREIDGLLALHPPHMSVYSLTIEDGTPFGRRAGDGERLVGDMDAQAAIDEHIAARLETAGLARYEVSNHARPGHECRHNLAYWRLEPYLGLGPGAHSDDGTHRFGNKRDVDAYARAWGPIDAAAEQRAAALDFVDRPDSRARVDEYLLMGLRLREGVDLGTIAARTGVNLASVAASTIARLQASGHLERSGSKLRATPAGMIILDRLVLDLASAAAARHPRAPF